MYMFSGLLVKYKINTLKLGLVFKLLFVKNVIC